MVSQSQPVDATTSITTSFGYDAAGGRTRYTDADKNITLYTYNSLGLPESSILPSVTGLTSAADRTTTTAYDADGRTHTITRPGGVVLTNGYDAGSELTSQTGTGAEAATTARSYGYDAAGRPNSVSAPGGTDTFTYNDRGLVVGMAGRPAPRVTATTRTARSAHVPTRPGPPPSATTPTSGSTARPTRSPAPPPP